VVARRAGFVVAAMINIVMWYAVNVWPGWQVVPFLTDDTRQVLAVVNLSLIVGVLVNLVHVTYDAPRLRPLGDLVTTGVGLIAMIRVLRVFPFDFSDFSFDASSLARVLLIIGIVGAALGVAVQFVTLVRRIIAGEAGAARGRADPRGRVRPVRRPSDG
jgi:hypothetical protein